MSTTLGDGRFFRCILGEGSRGWRYFAVDGLGQGRLSVNLMEVPEGSPCTADGASGWTFLPGEGSFQWRSEGSKGGVNQGLAFVFDRSSSSATLLGRFTLESLATAPASAHVLRDGDDGSGGFIELPALLHFPDNGSIEISSSRPVAVHVRASRQRNGHGTTVLELPAGDSDAIDYTWRVTACHPDSVPEDPVFDTVRRNFLNGLQVNPQLRMLANSSAGGAGPFALYFYSSVATYAVRLAPGLTTLDILRQSLERYLAGFHAYGTAGYLPEIPHDFLDSYPSLLIAVANYVEPSGDIHWLSSHYPCLRTWAERILSQDLDSDGLLEYPASGNSGSWHKILNLRPSNWWDTIGFGHKDAYGNALAAEAMRCMARFAQLGGLENDAARYGKAASSIRLQFVPTFLNPETGILAGWRSADGKLHDHWFLFLNSLAIVLDLVPEDLAHSIMDRLLAKLEEVGFGRFDLGLPGNLVPVPRCDYVHHDLRWGGGACEDNVDGFQIYENGGATACFAGFTIEALYKLGRVADGDRILFPMLEGFDRGNFQGPCANGRTKDWRAWDGTCHGYEGLLADGYLTLRAVLKRPQGQPDFGFFPSRAAQRAGDRPVSRLNCR